MSRTFTPFDLVQLPRCSGTEAHVLTTSLLTVADAETADPDLDDYIYGEGGYDVMHFGICDGGSPTTDTHCADVGEWDAWPDYGTAGDCCCHSCTTHSSCYYTDLTPLIDCPIPWGL